MPDIRHFLTIRATPEKVYHALTTEEGLSKWWTPEVHDFIEEKAFTFGFGVDYHKKMKVIETIPNEYVEWFCVEATEEWLRTTIKFQLHEADGHTQLFFEHNEWKAYTPLFSRCSFDWAIFLKSLKLHCENGKGHPYPDYLK